MKYFRNCLLQPSATHMSPVNKSTNKIQTQIYSQIIKQGPEIFVD